ncbi:MAG: hypothetical protein C4534_09375 [Gaiellales bacterium]|nr:MAG: hypothetical protein C4534_09375 [Gaiellales bacterium]
MKEVDAMSKQTLDWYEDMAMEIHHNEDGSATFVFDECGTDPETGRFGTYTSSTTISKADYEASLADRTLKV